MIDDIDTFLQREVRLANGVKLPLFFVASTLHKIENMLSGTERERELVAELRRSSLEHADIDKRYVEELRQRGMTQVERGLNREIVERMTMCVILAAVRGEGNQLSLASPYVLRQDRVLSDLIVSTMNAQALLPPEQAADLLSPSGKAGSWLTKIVNERTGRGSDGVPPVSPN